MTLFGRTDMVGGPPKSGKLARKLASYNWGYSGYWGASSRTKLLILGSTAPPESQTALAEHA